MAKGAAAPPTSATSVVPVALALGVAGGALIASQSRINAQLGTDLHRPLLAALASNTFGLFVLLVVVAVRRPTRVGFGRLRRRALPWWRYLGGANGSVLVSGAAVIVPHLGVALFTIGQVAGQTAGGLAVDRIGLGPGGRRPVTVLRLAGAGLALVAVVVAELGRAGDVSVPLLVAACVIGVGSAVQQALNGTVQQAAGDGLTATTINFVVGTAVLAVAYAVASVAGAGGHRAWPGHWYLYVGGPLGVLVVLTAVVAVSALGVLRLGLSVIAGQLAAAVVLDVALPAHGSTITPTVVVGVLLTFVAVAVAGRVGAGQGGVPAGGTLKP